MKKLYVVPSSYVTTVNSADILLLSGNATGFGIEVDYSEFEFID